MRTIKRPPAARLAACSFATLALFAAVPVLAATPDPNPAGLPGGGTLTEGPGPRPTADEVLDGKIPGRPDALPIKVEFDARGFAAARLYHVPPPGQHPRVLFSAEDLPRIRQQMEATSTGREVMAQLAKLAGLPEQDPENWQSKAYRALAAGDLERYAAICAATPGSTPTGPPGAVGTPINNLLFYRSLDAVLRGDTARGQEAAAAVAGYAQSLLPKVQAALAKPVSENFWLEIRNVTPDIEGVGFLYDLTQPYMTGAQAAATHDFIVLCTRGRYGLGMDLPSHWRRWNFIGMGLYFPLLELSIEGEPGYDQRIVDRGAEVARDYILYSVSDQGVGREAVGYQTAGLSHFSMFALALANRGSNLLTLARYRRLFDHWLLWAMQPFGRFWESGGDLGTFPPEGNVVRVARYFYPDDPAVETIAGQCEPRVRVGGSFPQDNLMTVLCPVDLGADFSAGKPPALPKDLPLTAYDPERGILFTRSSTEPDAAVLQFQARSDTVYATHDHADRGDFFLSALGQPWSVSEMRETQSRFHSLIAIDGKGEGFFATPARWLGVTDSPEAVFASVDTKYCYDWRWMKTADLATDEQYAREPWLAVFRDARDALLKSTPLDQWQRDPLPQVVDYYKDWFAGDPRMWGEEDTWVARAPYNPVRKSFRSIGFIRGPRPFVIVADDIRKDDAAHLYEWRMMMPFNVEAKEMNGADIIIGPAGPTDPIPDNVTLAYTSTRRVPSKPGTPLLLVRILRMTPTAPADEAPAPALESVEFVAPDPAQQFAGRSFGMGKRLVLPTRCVEPKYRVLLYPFLSGEKLPDTSWESPDVLSVTAGGKTQRIEFKTGDDGHTALDLVRSGN